MRRPRAVLLLLGCLAFATVTADTQQPGFPTGGRPRPVTPPRAGAPTEELRGSSAIKGVVISADTGTPIRRAQVRASAPGLRDSRLATTDGLGRFEFKELPAGRYTLSASKGGFVSLQYGQRRPAEPGTPLELGDNQTLDKVLIALPHGSVISGRITDEFGEPVANAAVTAMRDGYSAGARRLVPAGGQGARDTTDDLGQFRLFGLPPGNYIVSASFRGGGGEITDPAGEPTGFAPTYYPGTPNMSEAQRVRLDIAQEQTNVIFALVATRLVRVSGSVLDSQGAPVQNGMVMLTPTDSRLGAVFQNNSGRIDRGTFRIANVAPGRYMLQTRTGMGRGPAADNAAAEMARQEIAVGSDDVEGVVLVTSPGARASGTIMTDTGEAPSIRPDQVQVIARPASVEPLGIAPGANARIADNWTFQLTGLFDARLFRASAPTGWLLKQVVLNGQDITDTPMPFAAGQSVSGLTIVITQKSSELSGSITDDRGQSINDATVVVFPADEKLWTYQSRHIRTARPDQDGRYQLRGLPAYQDYLVAVVQALEEGQASDPDFLARLKPSAARLSLNDGETKAVDLKLPR